jgi:sulfur-oxidizing protein SoxX
MRREARSQLQRGGRTAALAVALLAAGVAASLEAHPDSDLPSVLTHTFGSAPARNAGALHQDAYQALCSQVPIPVAAVEAQRVAAAATVELPGAAGYVGDWQRGERIAREARGGQFDEPAGTQTGGNCYACHQLDPREPAYGTLGPSLLGYGRRHQNDPEALRHAWAQLWDAQAVTACSVMPRFGRRGILDVAQLRDLMALLFAPDSPVNRDGATP